MARRLFWHGLGILTRLPRRLNCSNLPRFRGARFQRARLKGTLETCPTETRPRNRPARTRTWGIVQWQLSASR
jgi:hypothetical protein